MHNWISTDTREYVSCLTCGGVWQRSADNLNYAESMRGGYPTACTGNTSQCHHYAGECYTDTCEIEPDCNCVFCDS